VLDRYQTYYDVIQVDDMT